MNKKHTLKILTVLAALCLLICQNANAKAKGVLPSNIPGGSFVPGQISAMMLDGPCFYLPSEGKKWQKAVRGMSFNNGDSIRTGSFGYMVIAFSDKDMVMLKPNSGIRVGLLEGKREQAAVAFYHGELMQAARNSNLVSIIGRHGVLSISHGEASMASNSEGETIKALRGTASFKADKSGQIINIPEGYMLGITADDIEKPLAGFDPKSEYDSYRRFERWLKGFHRVYERQNLNVNYRVSRAKINGKFLNDLVRKENGYYCIESDNGAAVKQIHLQIKLEPYPAINDQIELNLGKDLVYAFREGRDGYHEVNFSLPSMPDFLIKVHAVDLAKRRNCIFSAGFTVQNTRSLKTEAKKFCKSLSYALARRDNNWLKKNVSKNYKDWQGNTTFDFIKMAEDTLRSYHDIRLTLHPFSFVFQNNKILIHLNYRLSALSRSWAWRCEDRGSEIITLILEDGVYKLYSKTSGLFFNKLKVAIDLKKGVVKGRIVDERTKMPISGVRVELVSTGYKTTTNSMGEYAIYNVVAGTYNIKFTKNGYGEITASKIVVRPSGEQF